MVKKTKDEIRFRIQIRKPVSMEKTMHWGEEIHEMSAFRNKIM